MTKQYLQLADAIDASTKTTGFERNCASAIRALVAQVEALKQQVTTQHMVALRARLAPDTHCFDDDTGKDVWSYSEAQLNQAVQDTLKEASAALAQPEPVELTDEQIIQIAISERVAEPGVAGYILPISFARAVLAAAKGGAL